MQDGLHAAAGAGAKVIQVLTGMQWRLDTTIGASLVLDFVPLNLGPIRVATQSSFAEVIEYNLASTQAFSLQEHPGV